MKQSVQFPNNQYQHFEMENNSKKKILSFSRSLGKLKWDNNKLQVDKIQTSIAVKQILINRKPLPISNQRVIDPYKMTKQLSKLYDQYPVNTQKEHQEFEYLPFIPSELLQNPLKIDPKFVMIYLPRIKYPRTNMDNYKEQKGRFQTDTESRWQKQGEKNDLKYLNQDESSMIPFTTLKDYLDIQNMTEAHQNIVQTSSSERK